MKKKIEILFNEEASREIEYLKKTVENEKRKALKIHSITSY